MADARVAVIGTGSMGRRHLQALTGLGIDIVGICDCRAEAAAGAAAQHGLPCAAVFVDAAQMLAATRPEGVVIATTAPSHAALTALAAKAGAAWILCEKPMATSLANCDLMIEACERTGTRLAINHQMRFMEQYLRAREIIEDPGFGGWGSITVVAGNLGLAMNATHYFEMFRWMTGEAAGNVSAWFSAEDVPNPRGPEFRDRAGCVRIETPSGRRFYLDASADQGHGVRVTYAGRAGVLVADELAGAMWLSQRSHEDLDLPTTRYGMASTDSEMSFAPADSLTPTRAVLEALITKDDYPDGQAGRLALSTLVAAHVSHESDHRPVYPRHEPLPLDLELPIA